MLKKQGLAGQSAQLRERATAALKAEASRERPAAFLAMLGDALSDLGAYRQAIPYFEDCIKLLVERQDPVGVADMLWRAGKCYAQCGLSDHAAIPLRAAAKLFRTRPEDPRFPVVLVALGNALRKSMPAEAETYYKEAALVWTGRGHLESATAAWVNLGVICSEHNRLPEALEYYSKALHIREAAAGTPSDRLGSLHNNIANCYRRMGDFEKARQSVEVALKLLQIAGSSTLGSAYGTRGLILRDQGQDQESLEWFRKAIRHFEDQPSPNIQNIAEELGYEADALKRLGQREDAAIAEKRAASLAASATDVPALSQDLGELGAGSPGAVFVELGFGLRPRDGIGRIQVGALADRMWAFTSRSGCGRYGGTVATPESSSVMFYAPDAEAFYRVLAPALVREPLCEGARITIRQGQSQREFSLPGRIM